MTIQTKFNIGDMVWCMVDNKPIEGKVFSVATSSLESRDTDVSYGLSAEENKFFFVKEDELHSTKEELKQYITSKFD